MPQTQDVILVNVGYPVPNPSLGIGTAAAADFYSTGSGINQPRTSQTISNTGLNPVPVYANWPGTAGVTLTVSSTAEPFIPNSNIPLYRISALLDGGMSVAEVKKDFPSLTAAQIEIARDFAKLFPNFGKPYPQKSLKQVLRDSGFAELKKALRKGKKRS